MKKVFVILFTSIICIAAGVAFAYYNTATIGYDNAKIINIDENRIEILDFVVDRKEVKRKIVDLLEKSKVDVIAI